MNNRLKKTKNAIIKKPYVFYFIGVFLAYLAINVLINKTFVTLPTLFTSYKLSFAIPFIALSLITALLAAANVNLVIIKFKELKQMNKKGNAGVGGMGALGIFGGILGGACPGCFVGLFPALLGLFGITASLSILPLYGLEIQMLSLVLLTISIFLLTRENICKVEINK
ncbi:hypothetical protein HYS72_02510 [Candidatus Pacearchaeota archaeon]|nr:hypothetical protein [Candidatus Pacearchaeota archaeon]MBI2056649.1 hypothetical protein [Candidatus Pacearchaeota archaeon]